jgi:hypothetical protein
MLTFGADIARSGQHFHVVTYFGHAGSRKNFGNLSSLSPSKPRKGMPPWALRLAQNREGFL